MAENIEGGNELQGLTPAEIIEAAENLVLEEEKIKGIVLITVKECDELDENGEPTNEVIAMTTIKETEEILNTIYTAADMFEEALEDSDNTGEEGGESSEA